MLSAHAVVYTAVLLLGAPALGAEYLGARRCKECHAPQFAQWLSTPHATADQRLPVQQRRDPRCTGCHSTSAIDGLAGVQCESCHGAGRHYWPAAVMKDRELARAVGLTSGGDEATCRRCHTADAPTLIPFDRARMLPLVRHRPAATRPR